MARVWTRTKCLPMVVLLLLWTSSLAGADSHSETSGRAAGDERRLADLQVLWIAHSPAPAVAGATLDIEIKIENDGSGESSGREELHFDCRNTDPSGPSCPFGKGTRPLPALTPGGQHTVQLLTNPWSVGRYQFTCWIVGPDSRTKARVRASLIEVVERSEPRRSS